MKILYTKENCAKCDTVKDRMEVALTVDGRDDVRIVDITNPEPYRKELIRNGAIEAVKKTLPVLVDEDGNVFIGALSVMNALGISDDR